MAFPRSVMDPDEQVLVHLHPHWRGLVRPALFGCVLTLLAGVGGGLVETQLAGTTEQTAMWLTLVAIWLLALVFATLLPISRWSRTDLVVTDRRVLYRSAGLWRRGVDVPLGRISAVRYRHTILERALGTGSLIIERGYLPPVEIDEVPHVARVHATLYDELANLRVSAAPMPQAVRGPRAWQRLLPGGTRGPGEGRGDPAVMHSRGRMRP